MTTVFFCSNRVTRGSIDEPASYTAEIQTQTDPTGLIYGTAFVDGVDIAGNKQGSITSMQNVATGDFLPEVADDLAQAGRNLLLFIHGFDNTFDDAITRAAFNRDWMAASGLPTADTTVIAFSWPSLGQILGFPLPSSDYKRDQNMARFSGYHGMTFFSRLEPILTAARRNGCRTYLLAHSMGHLLLQSAVESWFLHGNGDAQLFDLAILAAGDCQYDSFDQPTPAQLSNLPLLAERIRIYYSHADVVLKVSDAINLGAQRLGEDGPNHRTDPSVYPPSQYSMVDATGFQDYDFTLLGSHQYYRSSPTCRADIGRSMT